MFFPPMVPSFAVFVFLLEGAEERIILQPSLFAGTESIEVRRMGGVSSSPPGKIRKRSLEKVHFQAADEIVSNRALAQLFEIVLCDNVVEILLRQIHGRTGRQMQGGGFERDCADRIVGAVIASHFVDGQELNDFESNPRGPIDKLPQRLQVADSEVGLGAQCEERGEDSGDFFVRRKVHDDHKGELKSDKVKTDSVVTM